MTFPKAEQQIHKMTTIFNQTGPEWKQLSFLSENSCHFVNSSVLLKVKQQFLMYKPSQTPNLQRRSFLKAKRGKKTFRGWTKFDTRNWWLRSKKVLPFFHNYLLRTLFVKNKIKARAQTYKWTKSALLSKTEAFYRENDWWSE